MHHPNNQYAPTNLLPPSPRALPSTTADPLLLTPILTPHLASGTSNLPTQPQIGPSLVPLSHEHSPAAINTLYANLQSAPKKRKLSQDGLIHVKQVLLHLACNYVPLFVYHLQYYYLPIRNPNWAPWSIVVAAVVQCWTTTRSPIAITLTPVTNAFGSIRSSKRPGTLCAIIISRNYRCRITGWTPTKDSILAIQTTRLSVRRKIISR